jgi:hypothetical protein
VLELSERTLLWRQFKNRFNPWDWVNSFLFMGSWFLARHLVAMPDLSHTLRVAVAFLPLPFLARIFWKEWRNADRMDELERQIMHRASHLALLVTVGVLLTLGLFERGVGVNRGEFGFEHIWFLPWIFQMVFFAITFKRFEKPQA